MRQSVRPDHCSGTLEEQRGGGRANRSPPVGTGSETKWITASGTIGGSSRVWEPNAATGIDKTTTWLRGARASSDQLACLGSACTDSHRRTGTKPDRNSSQIPIITVGLGHFVCCCWRRQQSGSDCTGITELGVTVGSANGDSSLSCMLP